MFSLVSKVAVGVLLLGVLAVAQGNRHNEARFDTLGGKRVIKLYSDGKLDTIIVLDTKKPATPPRARQHIQPERTSDSAWHMQSNRHMLQLEEYARQAERYAQEAKRYARKAEQYARRAQEFAQRYGLSDKEPAFPPPPRGLDRNVVPLPPHNVPPPDIPDDAQLRRRLEQSFQQLKQAWEEYRRLIPQQHDTTKLNTLPPNQFDQLDDAVRRSLDTALKTLEQYRSLSSSIRRWTKEVQSHLERLRELFKRYRDDDNYP